MRKRRVFASAAVLLLLHLQTACSVYRPVPLSSIAPGTDVRVRFPHQAPVVVGHKERNSVRYVEVPAVRAVDGKFISIAADTMRLGPVRYMHSPGIPPYETYHSASFDVSAAGPVEVRRFDPGRTTLLVVGLSAVAAAAFVILNWNMDMDFGDFQM